jgi:hypothetical protein
MRLQSVSGGKGIMPAWQDRLSPDDRWAAVEYARAFAYQPVKKVNGAAQDLAAHAAGKQRAGFAGRAGKGEAQDRRDQSTARLASSTLLRNKWQDRRKSPL